MTTLIRSINSSVPVAQRKREAASLLSRLEGDIGREEEFAIIQEIGRYYADVVDLENFSSRQVKAITEEFTSFYKPLLQSNPEIAKDFLQNSSKGAPKEGLIKFALDSVNKVLNKSNADLRKGKTGAPLALGLDNEQLNATDASSALRQLRDDPNFNRLPQSFMRQAENQFEQANQRHVEAERAARELEKQQAEAARQADRQRKRIAGLINAEITHRTGVSPRQGGAADIIRREQLVDQILNNVISPAEGGQGSPTIAQSSRQVIDQSGVGFASQPPARARGFLIPPQVNDSRPAGRGLGDMIGGLTDSALSSARSGDQEVNLLNHMTRASREFIEARDARIQEVHRS